MKKIYLLAVILCVAFSLAACTADYDGTKGLDFEEIEAGYVISGYDGEASKVTIPEEYKGQKVIGIQADAFSGNEIIKQVNVAPSVRYIEERAFSENPNLTGVVLPKSVDTIDKEAFYQNKKLTLYCEVAGKPEGWSYKWKDSANDVSWNNTQGDIQEWKSLANLKMAPGNNDFQAEGVRISSDYTPKAKTKNYTVLYYINGRDPQSYLYAQELQNLVRVMAEEPKLEDSVNVVVEVASGYSFGYEHLQKDTNYRFTVNGNGVQNISDIGMRNAGESNALSDFINYGKISYPAKHTILLMSGSGNGQDGVYWTDQAYENEAGDGVLSMIELRDALAGSAASEEKLDLFLMKANGGANAEWIYQMEAYAGNLLATPGRIQGAPLSQNWIAQLKAEPGQKLYAAIREELTEELAQDAENAPFAVIPLEAAKKQLAQWNQKLVALDEAQLEEAMEKTDTLRMSSQYYYDGYYTGAPIHMRLSDLSETAFSGLDKTLKEESLKGLSIYMPRYFQEQEEIASYEAFSKMEGYTRYVKALQQYEESGDVTPLEKMKLAVPKQTGTYLNYAMNDIRALYEVQFMRDEKNTDILYAYGFDNSGKVSVDGEVMERLSTSTFSFKDILFCAVEQSSSDAVPHTYWIPVLINGKFDALQVESDTEDLVTALQNRKEGLKETDEITPLYPIITTRSAKDEIFQGKEYYSGKYRKGESFTLKGMQEGATLRLARSEYKNSQRLFLLIKENGEKRFSFAG